MQVDTGREKQIAILNALLDLVAERGFHGTAMSQVAKRSGVSAGIIYHYYENKEDLIHKLYYQIKADFSAAMAQDVEALTFPDDLKRIWRNAFEYYVSHSKQATYLEQYENSPYYDAHQGYDELLAQDENMQLLMGKFQTNYDNGNIRPVHFMVMYEMTLGVAAGLAKRVNQGVLELDDAELEAITQGILQSISSGGVTIGAERGTSG